MRKDSDKPENYVAGDEVCRSCLGITYMSLYMREKKKIHWCIGYRSKLPKIVEPKHLKEFERGAEKDFEWQIAVGQTMSTRRMDRTGCAPLGIWGVTYSKAAAAPVSPDNDQPDTAQNAVPDGDFTAHTQYEQVSLLTSGFGDLMMKGINFEIKTMKALCHRATRPEFPGKFYRSSVAITNNATKIAGGIAGEMKKFIVYIFS